MKNLIQIILYLKELRDVNVWKSIYEQILIYFKALDENNGFTKKNGL